MVVLANRTQPEFAGHPSAASAAAAAANRQGCGLLWLKHFHLSALSWTSCW